MTTQPFPPHVADLCCNRLRRSPDRVAVETPSATLRNRELLAAGECVREQIRMAGVVSGDPIVLALPNELVFAPACLALFLESAPVILLSPKAGVDEIRFVLETTGARFCIAPGHFAGRAGALFARGEPLETGGLEADAWLLRSGFDRPAPPGIRDAAVVKYTSGSTGRPKGVALRAEQVIAEREAVVAGLGLGPEDRVLATVPVTHSYGFDLGVLPALFGEATLVLHDSFVPPRTMRALTDGSTTVFLGVPGLYRFLVDAPAGPPLSPRLRYLLSCTAPLPVELSDRFQRRFGRAIVQHYGSSETGAVALHEEGEVDRRVGSVGRAMPGVRIRILDEQGRPVPAGTVGEVHVAGPAVAVGYAPGSAPPNDPFDDRGYRTGDLGWLDERGFLFVNGRKDDVINVGGLKVFPEEVRGVLQGLAGIREVAVRAGTTLRGESFVLAAVTLRSALTEEEILEHCRRHLADYKVPRRVEILDRLPGSGASQAGPVAKEMSA